ncbi:MAG TPA: ABC transporter permease, partial [Gemmatimonadaceae bacterium]|nr:ABC transporter permease [Gemmatimonadaceae bacterium]
YMHDPATVNRVFIQSSYRGVVSTRPSMPYARYLDFKRTTHSFSQFAAVSEWRFAVGTGQDTRLRRVDGVNATFFDFFDARPALGRWFTPAEDSTPSGTPVAVLSYGFWKSELGGRNVINERMEVSSVMYTIVGVAPEGFVGAGQTRAPDLFIPISTVPAMTDASSSLTYTTKYNWDWMEFIVRRKPGVDVAAASADLTTAYSLSRAIQRATVPTVVPDSIAKPRGIAGSLKNAGGPDPSIEQRVLLWVGGVALMVLLIACANVANLMLARVLARRREIAVRLALGVSRRRLAMQFITEGLLLALLGCVAGMFVAQWGGVAIRSLIQVDRSSFDLATDWRTISIATVCAVIAALLTAAGPALLATRSDLAATLKAGARAGGHHRSRLRGSLLVLQGGLSVALLVGAGLFVRSLQNVLAIPLGYDAANVLEIGPVLRHVTMDTAETIAFRRRLLATAQAIPGVEAAARVNSMLFGTNSADLRVAGIDSVTRLGRFNFQVASSDYFKVMRTRILRGRALNESDRQGAPLATVVSAAMAKVLWPGKDAIGQCIYVGFNTLGSFSNTAPCTTVVGIAEDAAYQNITDDERYTYYLPVEQIGPSWSSTMLVRVRGANIEAETERVRRAMQAAMPGDGFVIVTTMQERVDKQRRTWRLGATLFAAFGGLALLVAAVGLYGATGYNVAQRMHELGVRIALGAQSSSIMRLIVGQGIAFAAAGAAMGLLIALAAARWMQPLLYKESARDPLVYAGVGAVIGIVAVIASAVPAARAVRADPNRALRAD